MNRRGRGALTAALLTLTGFVGAGCSTSIPASQILGPNVGVVTVLADSPAVPAVRCALTRYVLQRASGIKLGAGTPTGIAAAVKDGEPTDVVILPAGAALKRVSDELTTSPTPIVTRPGQTTWWVAAVTDKGVRLAGFLSGTQGRSLLGSSECLAPSLSSAHLGRPWSHSRG